VLGIDRTKKKSGEALAPPLRRSQRTSPVGFLASASITTLAPFLIGPLLALASFMAPFVTALAALLFVPVLALLLASVALSAIPLA
jgi:hypothetical protein